jgi:Tol biopolymer transport system component
VRPLNEFDAKFIGGTDTNPANPFFSPDGKWIGYFSRADSKLKKIAVGGGVPIALCDASNVIGASWDANDKIMYAEYRKGISRVSANGGTPELIIEGSACCPQLLPDGKSLLFTFGTIPPLKTIVKSLQSGERRELFTGDTARYLSTGHIVYALGSNLTAVPFDLKTLKVTGGQVPLFEGMWRNRAGVSQYAVSDSGTLVYIPGTVGVGGSAQRTLVWVDRKGNEQPLTAQPNDYHWPHISPDGTKLALGIVTGDFFAGNAKQDIWLWDLVRETPTRLTFNEGSTCPLWTLDGRRIAFATRNPKNNNNIDVFLKAADGTGADEKIGSVPGQSLYPWSWSRDGKILVTQGREIGSLLMEGDHQYRQLLEPGKFAMGYAQISPDGRWMAYASNESGMGVEIYVRPFPDVNSGHVKVSTSGGNCPLWSLDSRELFYRSGDSVMAVALEAGQTFKCGKPEFLFRGPYTSSKPDDGHPWDISRPDGKRFLMMKEAGTNASAAEGPRKINIVLNWFEELKQRVPVK